jgi:hypothetical protein
LDGGIGAVIGGFEPAVGTVLRVWLVMETAVGERPAEALVEEQEEQGHLDAFLGEAVGVSREPSRSIRPCPLSLRRS